MQKAEDYRRHADTCRALARNATSEDERRQLMHMAETWLGLAEQRLHMLMLNSANAGPVRGAERTLPETPVHEAALTSASV